MSSLKESVVVLFLFFVLQSLALPPPSPPTPKLYIFCQHNLQVSSNVGVVKGLIDQGSAAGYNGIVIADFKLTILHNNVVIPQYYTNLQEIISYALSKGWDVIPAIYPFGYSEGILYTDYNLAEGLPIKGSPFVSTGTTLALNSNWNNLVNGDFEQMSGNNFVGWNIMDPSRVSPDTSTAHSGTRSVHISAGSGNARITQAMTFTPFRQYHVTFWIKSSNFANGYVNVVFLDFSIGGQPRNFLNLRVAPTQNWTRYDFVLFTQSSSQLTMYLGSWGGQSGDLWFDSVSIVETALVNLIRRSGAPLRVYNTNNPSQVYIEGVDYNNITDPLASKFDLWHTPPTVTIPSGSSIQTGTQVSIDYYAVAPIDISPGFTQVGACLTENAIMDYMRNNIRAVAAQFPPQTSYFLGYDEMRQMHTCDLCHRMFPTAGQLLAWHVGQAYQIIRSASVNTSNSRIMVWSDMFDPYHNAVDYYYYVNTTVAGSWNGLPCGTVVFDWNLGQLTESLQFFSNLSLATIVAGYYDSGDGARSAQDEMAAAAKIPGLQGFMYTTWNPDYSELANYGNTIRNGWSNIISSEGDPNPCPSSTPSSSTSTTSTTMTTTTSSPQSPNLPVPPTPSTAPQSSPQSPSTTSSNPSTTRQAINQTSQTLIDPVFVVGTILSLVVTLI